MSFPEAFCVRMKAMLGEEYDAFIAAFSEEVTYRGVRINTLKTGACEAVLSKLVNAEPISWCDDGYYADEGCISGRHAYHAAGLLYFQEPSAMAAVPLAGIKPGMRVLDLCAAPGGKATQAAAALCGEGLLVANEIIPKRAKILAENIERMGIKNAVVTNETPERLLQKFPDFFDCIILDAPCSGEGMFRKEPQAVTEWSEAHSNTCAVRQKHIADCAVGMLADGGRLIYSTCTFAPAENEGVAGYITDTYPEMALIEPEKRGLSDGFDELARTKRVFPHRARGEGHFYALFQKRGGNRAEPQSVKPVKSPEYEAFCKDNLKNPPKGILTAFGDRLYLLPEGISIDKIKVVRAGLELGEIRKGRFLPAHALALALSTEDFSKTVNFSAESDEIRRYLSGETLTADISGWCVVLADGFPLGWAKGSDGVLKNHYPKGLRQ